MNGFCRFDEICRSMVPRYSSRVDPELYQRLRCTYEAQPSLDVKHCFLYCALNHEDYKIPVEKLVQMWIAEGLVRCNQGDDLLAMPIGSTCVKLVANRCLFKNEDICNPCEVAELESKRVHDVIPDMAIYIGEKEENCVFKAGQQLRDFPEIHGAYCKRISVLGNEIENLPTESTRPKLVSPPFLECN